MIQDIDDPFVVPSEKYSSALLASMFANRLRQPGSGFKPFVMTAAVAGGIPTTNIQVDSFFTMTMPDGQVWTPENFDPDYRGPLNMRETLENSVNIPTVKLALETGIDAVAQYARRMGIRSEIPPYPSIALGAADVIPM